MGWGLSYNQLEKAIQYVQDNPRRAIIKRARPDLFKRYLHLEIGNHEYAAFGNIFLLRHFNLLPVRIHRRWSEEEFEQYHKDCMQKIQNGAIPISPFIHDAEKRIMRATMDLGYPLIKLTDCGFEDRFKPRGGGFRSMRRRAAAPACSVAGKYRPEIHCRLHRIPPDERPGPYNRLSFSRRSPLHNCTVMFFAVWGIIAKFAGN